MELNDKYQVMDDPDLKNAGFQNVSEHDLQCQRLINEIKSYSPLSTYGFVFSALLFGLHRFRAGKFFTGLLYLFTGGGFCIWMVIDIISIASGKWTDKNGLPINPARVVALKTQLKALDSRYANLAL